MRKTRKKKNSHPHTTSYDNITLDEAIRQESMKVSNAEFQPVDEELPNPITPLGSEFNSIDSVNGDLATNDGVLTSGNTLYTGNGPYVTAGSTSNTVQTIATSDDIDELKKEIFELRKRLDAMEPYVGLNNEK